MTYKNIRITEEAYRLLSAKAEKNRRTLSGELEWILSNGEVGREAPQAPYRPDISSGFADIISGDELKAMYFADKLEMLGDAKEMEFEWDLLPKMQRRDDVIGTVHQGKWAPFARVL